jgi:5-methylcytosine-specific restriction enzyme A
MEITKNVRLLPWERKPVKKSWSYNDDKRYKLSRWTNLAKAHKLKNSFCVECKKQGIIKTADVTDHIHAVRLGGSFWDWNNLQSLCTSHHNIKKD